jgi:hypothetical protein
MLYKPSGSFARVASIAEIEEILSPLKSSRARLAYRNIPDALSHTPLIILSRIF